MTFGQTTDLEVLWAVSRKSTRYCGRADVLGGSKGRGEGRVHELEEGQMQEKLGNRQIGCGIEVITGKRG